MNFWHKNIYSPHENITNRGLLQKRKSHIVVFLWTFLVEWLWNDGRGALSLNGVFTLKNWCLQNFPLPFPHFVLSHFPSFFPYLTHKNYMVSTKKIVLAVFGSFTRNIISRGSFFCNPLHRTTIRHTSACMGSAVYDILLLQDEGQLQVCR